MCIYRLRPEKDAGVTALKNNVKGVKVLLQLVKSESKLGRCSVRAVGQERLPGRAVTPAWPLGVRIADGGNGPGLRAPGVDTGERGPPA